jgi:hypothetical protein
MNFGRKHVRGQKQCANAILQWIHQSDSLDNRPKFNLITRFTLLISDYLALRSGAWLSALSVRGNSLTCKMGTITAETATLRLWYGNINILFAGFYLKAL